MKSGTKLVVVLIGATIAVAALRTLCVPVGSFREGLDRLAWGLPADSVLGVLGPPNRICTDPTVSHLDLRGTGAEAVRRAIAGATTERWIYSERPPRGSAPRDPGPACQAPVMATELGFDATGGLRWVVRETQQTPVAFDPALVSD